MKKYYNPEKDGTNKEIEYREKGPEKAIKKNRINIFADGDRPELDQVLARREDRRRDIEKLLKDSDNMALLSFKLNIPGPVKNNKYIKALYKEGLGLIREKMPKPVKELEYSGITGNEYMALYPAGALDIKRKAISLEESPLGRLFDLDVEDEKGAVKREDLGLDPRTCFICQRPAVECARSRRHSIEEMTERIEAMIRSYFSEEILENL